jgi:hypothetical protein
VRQNVTLIQGLFAETLPQFCAQHAAERISLLHVDWISTRQTRTIFDLVGDKIAQGTVIVFDQYFNFPTWRHHEYKAFHEFCAKRGLQYKCHSFVSSHQQVCVVVE